MIKDSNCNISTKRLKIAYICGYSEDAYGGVQTVVPQYLEHMSEVADVSILSIGTKKFETTGKYNVLKDENDFWKQSFDLAVFHEVYYFPYHRIARKLIKRNIKYIVIPHCSLTSEAQKQKMIVKKILNHIYFEQFVSNATAIQFLSNIELEMSSAFKCQKKFIVSNGTDSKQSHNRTYKKAQGLRILYIGRLCIKQKGLDLLIEACNMIKQQMLEKTIILDIYGPNYEKDREKLCKMIKQYELEHCVHICDGVYGKDKETVYHEHDVFIHTSRFEGHPVGVMEAMQQGLPIIVTPGTSFDKLVLEYNCGWETTVSAEAIAKTILQAYEEREQLQVMSQNAIEAVKKQFDWNVIVDKTIEQYQRILCESE